MDDTTKRNSMERDGPTIQLGQLAETTGFLIRRLHNFSAGSWNYGQLAGGDNITAVQAGLLILIDENPMVTQSQLAPVLDVETPTLVRSITRLAELGLIRKDIDEHDRRSSRLNLTPAGQEVVQRMKRYMLERESRLTEALSREEVKTLKTLLKKVISRHSRSDAWDF